MNVIVTGAAGHLGSHLVPELVKAGFTVTGLDIAEPPASLPEGCEFFRTDLTDTDALAGVMRGAEMVVHCASIHPWKPYADAQYLDANVKGTWMVYTTAVALGIERIVMTSSIAAGGYHNVPAANWPVTEEMQFPLGDLYSFTKHAQEDVARMFAGRGQVRTLALRPPAFMPAPELETGFRLTGCFAVVDDIVSAHVAAARVMAGRQEPGESLSPFEALFITNRLPYTAEDGEWLARERDVRPLVRKHWPDAYEWLMARGFNGGWVPAVYDSSKAERVLGWRCKRNFEEWFAGQSA